MSAEKGREARPGDRGDASNKAGIAALQGGNVGTLASECSKGYERVSGGWVGNVKR